MYRTWGEGTGSRIKLVWEQMMGINNTYEKEDKLIKNIIATGCKAVINDPRVYKYVKDMAECSRQLYIHSINVAILSLIMGIKVIDDSKKLAELFTAALLHDYGKLFVPAKILNKTCGLTEHERCEIEKHSEIGYQRLLTDKYFNDRVLLGVLEHHERMDGTGYAKGKCGSDISSYAKIIMIADVYDAMISDRVYRTRIDRGIVYEYLFSNAGKHFSRLLIKSFINSTLSLELDYVICEVEREIFGDSIDETVKICL